MKKLSLLCALLIAFSCSVEDDYVQNLPEQALLIFPNNNQECNQGVEIPGTNNTNVTFTWENDINAESYALVIKNLITQIERSYTSNSNEFTASIEKATPYSWYVITYNAINLETVESDIWKFYNAGDPVTSYTPFPADAVYPEMAGVYSGITTIRLEWDGLDIDNDITDYDVYFDTETTPTNLIGNTIQNTMDTEVVAGNIYYWRIVTNDAEGNNSQSEIFQFKVD